MTFSLWSHLGLNQGPPDYESGATNQLSYRTPNSQHITEIRCKGTAFFWNNQIILIFCGDSGIRTRVQTRNQYAFYTLILAFIFEQRQDPSHQPLPYLLKSHFCIAAYRNQPWYFRTAWSYQPLGVGLERCLGSAPCAETRRIYYTSITQRELQYCCQL